MRAGVGLAVAEGLHLTVVCVRVCAGGYAQERERARARERESVCVCVCVREREREREGKSTDEVCFGGDSAFLPASRPNHPHRVNRRCGSHYRAQHSVVSCKRDLLRE